MKDADFRPFPVRMVRPDTNATVVRVLSRVLARLMAEPSRENGRTNLERAKRAQLGRLVGLGLIVLGVVVVLVLVYVI